jgi:hypothetical protein
VHDLERHAPQVDVVEEQHQQRDSQEQDDDGANGRPHGMGQKRSYYTALAAQPPSNATCCC